jgi:hypothetical protein
METETTSTPRWTRAQDATYNAAEDRAAEALEALAATPAPPGVKRSTHCRPTPEWVLAQGRRT